MRVALTGGSSGIGAAVAARLKRDGHHVTAFDLTEPSENIDAWVELNLTDAVSIAAAAAKVSDQSFDVLINNAGLPPREAVLTITPPSGSRSSIRSMKAFRPK